MERKCLNGRSGVGASRAALRHETLPPPDDSHATLTTETTQMSAIAWQVALVSGATMAVLTAIAPLNV